MAISSGQTPNALRHVEAVHVFLDDDVAPFGFHVRDDTVTEMDKTDYTFMADIKATGASSTVLAEWALEVTDNGDDDAVDPDLVRVVFSLMHDEVNDLGVGSYVWDLQVDGSTGRWTPVTGTLTITQDVTR